MEIKNSVLFIVLFTVFAAGETAAPLHVDFRKIEVRSTRTDTVSGTIYSFRDSIVIFTREPIPQYMFIDTVKTIIYFPLEKKGLQLQRNRRAVLPFFDIFIGFLRSSTIFAQIHFKISETGKKGDTLRFRWIPEDRKSPFRGSLETVYCKDKPLSASTFDKKRKLLSRIVFSCDTLINGRFVPFRISTMTILEGDTLREDVGFSNLVIGNGIPAEIRNFRIPEGIPVKVIEW